MRVPVLLSLLLAASRSVIGQSVSDKNLIGHWSFDEASGSVATEETGSFPGTIYNATRVPGRIGGALEFNGMNSYVYVGGQGSALQLARTNYTIAWWQKRGDSTGWHEDIICMDDGAEYSGGWQIYLPFGTPEIALVHSDGILGESNVWFDAATTDSSWHHYAVTFDGANRRFYIDGVLAGARATANGIRTDGDDPLLFGAMQIQSGTVLNFFKGTLDEIRIYNRPLTADEISILGFGAGAPFIVNQPMPQEALAGSAATFAVGATGTAPLQYQWVHAGTNLTDSAHFMGADSWQLKISNVTPDDAGDYSVIVSNSVDHVTSQTAGLAVIVDTNAPVVTITSPVAGPQSSGIFTLQGEVAEPYGLASITWELNGQAKGPLSATAGQFFVADQSFDLGDNRIKVTATDLSGNVGSAEVVANWTIARLLTLDGSPTQQEGGRITIPVSLSSTGGVSGATFIVGYNASVLTDAKFEWSDALADGFVLVNAGTGSIRCSFALPGVEIPAEPITLGTISFRVRSIPTNLATPISLLLQDISSSNGDPYTSGNYVHGTTATLTTRKIVGDNNANDRYDVGDASVILSLITGVETLRSWDIAENDINKSFSLDSGDAIRVLRAVVGIDPQPQLPVAPLRVAALATPATTLTSSSIELVFDKPTALPGQKITLEARLKAQTQPVSGASFRLEYPVDALRLENASALAVGSIVPAGAMAIWNVSPSQNNYAAQDGAVSFGVSSGSAWSANNGPLARITFTVQAGATTRYAWPVQLKNLEVSRDGFQTEMLGEVAMNFVARPPLAATFQPSITFNSLGVAQLLLQGDLGATYVVETSSDLKNWTQLGVYSTTTNGTIAVEDSQAAASTTRFYRATLAQ